MYELKSDKFSPELTVQLELLLINDHVVSSLSLFNYDETLHGKFSKRIHDVFRFVFERFEHQ